MRSRRATTVDWLRQHPLRAVLVAIAAITALTGVAEILAPAAVLTVLGAVPTPLATQLFATVGLFMVVVGGLLTQSLLRRTPHRDVVFWSGLQKAAASVAVGVGVFTGVFDRIALLVSAFDLATAVLLYVYWQRLRRRVVSHRPPVSADPQRNDDSS
ncbi:hypothetical protein [Cryobacterium sp. MLB-32]|uniref:hypothetical protein n=1 Tax=Cryobacterium sp. MLB-32 TaxID=1529318 RepID=UPI0018CDBB25|nr:hypothetical protein [Cryobacterium sp. MLB-32]